MVYGNNVTNSNTKLTVHVYILSFWPRHMALYLIDFTFVIIISSIQKSSRSRVKVICLACCFAFACLRPQFWGRTTIAVPIEIILKRGYKISFSSLRTPWLIRQCHFLEVHDISDNFNWTVKPLQESWYSEMLPEDVYFQISHKSYTQKTLTAFSLQ